MRFRQISGRSIRSIVNEFQIDTANINWIKRHKGWMTRFEVGDTIYQVDIDHSSRSSIKTGREVAGVTVAFASLKIDNNKVVDSSIANTGDKGYSARNVFSKVISAIIDFCRQNDPQFISFQANKNDGKLKSYLKIIAFLKKRLQTDGYHNTEIRNKLHQSPTVVLWHDSELGINENATAGATGASSVATSVGGAPKAGAIGVGFNPDGDQGVYQGKPKRAKTRPPVLRR